MRVADSHRLTDNALILVGGLIVYALNVDFLLRGDAAMYADYVLLGKFDELTLHIGYYAILFAADRTVGAALQIPLHELMVWLGVVAAALSLCVAYELAKHFLGARSWALLSVLVLALSGRFLANATTSEIYMVQTLFVLVAFLLFARERFVLSGLVAAFSLLVSPLSIFAFLFFPVLQYQRGALFSWRIWARFVAAALGLYLPYLLVHGSELLWGKRGLLNISDVWPLRPDEAIVNIPLFQFKHFTVLLLLLVPALFALRRNRHFIALSLAVALPHLYLVLKLTSEDNVFLLNTDFFFACVLVLGLRELAASRLGAMAATTILGAHVVLMVASCSLFCAGSNKGFADEMRAIARTHIENREAVLVTDWSTGKALVYFGRSEVSSTLEKEPLHEHVYDITAIARQAPGALDTPEIYLLDSWEAGGLRRLLSSERSIAELRSTHSLVAQAGRFLNLSCSLVEQGTLPLYRCVKRVPTIPALGI